MTVVILVVVHIPSYSCRETTGSGRVNDQEDIPSHAEVVRARQRRERMREMTGIIPLEDTSFSKELDTDEINSRLVRDDEEDPEPGRRSFFR